MYGYEYALGTALVPKELEQQWQIQQFENERLKAENELLKKELATIVSQTERV